MKRKALGAYYTPERVVRCLVRWAVRRETDRLLDPACGDGRFLLAHANSYGVEHDADAASRARQQAPGRPIWQGDFFAWASRTPERFESAAGNPPFIRYQRFSGDVRKAARDLCARHGADFSSLSSSWAPFIVGAATLLKPGGRLAFVVPAEIGHAPYARPLMEYLAANFATVHVIAVRGKLFPDLSEDCWLLFADGFGERTDSFRFTAVERFRASSRPPSTFLRVSLSEWRQWNGRLRPLLASAEVRSLYREFAGDADAVRLGQVAKVSIGYVTGANDFFHLSPSEAEARGIDQQFLHPAVRNGRSLKGRAVTWSTVQGWWRRDARMLLLHLNGQDELPRGVREYLESEEAQKVRLRYECRTRTPWYVVPDVTVPDAFLTYMSGGGPALVANPARCAATNSVHVVVLTGGMTIRHLQAAWEQPITRLSCEIEGHPLGGGLLKLEPREASRVLLVPKPLRSRQARTRFVEGLREMRRWRHYAKIYAQYDQRFVYSAPRLARVTARLAWAPVSPVLDDDRVAGYEPRVAHPGSS